MAKRKGIQAMTLNFNAKTYSCDYVEVGANEDGEIIVTLVGNFPAPEQMTVDDVASITSDPLLYELLRLAYQNAVPGTPVFRAFARMKKSSEEATFVLRFEQPDAEVAA